MNLTVQAKNTCVKVTKVDRRNKTITLEYTDEAPNTDFVDSIWNGKSTCYEIGVDQNGNLVIKEKETA
jgi:hypothetical protein